MLIKNKPKDNGGYYFEIGFNSHVVGYSLLNLPLFYCSNKVN